MTQTWTLLEGILSEGPALNKLTKYVTNRWGQDEADELVRAMQEVPADRLWPIVTKRYTDPELERLFIDAAEEGWGSFSAAKDAEKAAEKGPEDPDEEPEEPEDTEFQGPVRGPGDRPEGPSIEPGYIILDPKTQRTSKLIKDKGGNVDRSFALAQKILNKLFPTTADRPGPRPRLVKVYTIVDPEGNQIGQPIWDKEDGDEHKSLELAQQALKKMEPTAKEPPPAKLPPWQAKLPNKIKGLPQAQAQLSTPQEPEEPESQEAEPEGEEDWRSLIPGRRRPDLPQTTGFASPTKLKTTKDQSSLAPSDVPVSRAKAGESGSNKVQKLLQRFIQVYGPKDTDTPDQKAQKMALVNKMFRKYGMPPPEFGKDGRLKVLNPDQLAKRMGEPGYQHTTGAERAAARTATKPTFPGGFVGQVVTRNGMAVPKTDYYMDMATGQMNRRKTEIDPKYTGPLWAWDGEDWIKLSELGAKIAAKRARAAGYTSQNGANPSHYQGWASPRKAKLD